MTPERLAQLKMHRESADRNLRENRLWAQITAGTIPVHMPPISLTRPTNSAQPTKTTSYSPKPVYNSRVISCLADPIRGVGGYSP